jgi:hypothetical protein
VGAFWEVEGEKFQTQTPAPMARKTAVCAASIFHLRDIQPLPRCSKRQHLPQQACLLASAYASIGQRRLRQPTQDEEHAGERRISRHAA